MSRLARMEVDFSRANPNIDYYLRCEALIERGVSKPLVESLWQSRDRSLLAQLEAASDADVRALNAAADAQNAPNHPANPSRD